MSNFTKRWFVLDLNQGKFYYTAGPNKNKPERSHDIEDITRFDPEPDKFEPCD